MGGIGIDRRDHLSVGIFVLRRDDALDGGSLLLTYYLLAIAVGRIRAEVGPPTNEMFLVNPRHFITDAIGTRRIPAGSLVMMGFYYTFNRGYRAHPMPHTLEGFKVADATQMDHRRLIGVMVLATVAGILTTFWAYLTLAYSSGGDNINVGLGNGAYSNMRSWLYNPTETNAPSVLFMTVGFLFTGFLWAIRTRFPLWPFHPPVTRLRAAHGLSDGYGFPCL